MLTLSAGRIGSTSSSSSCGSSEYSGEVIPHHPGVFLYIMEKMCGQCVKAFEHYVNLKGSFNFLLLYNS